MVILFTCCIIADSGEKFNRSRIIFHDPASVSGSGKQSAVKDRLICDLDCKSLQRLENYVCTQLLFFLARE